MADPFSVTGSAVGVISLGISVCQGLLAYYDSFKAYDEQIKDVSLRVQSFSNILKALNEVLSDAQASSSILATRQGAVALDCIFNCQEGLERLQKVLEKCKYSPLNLSFLSSKFQINRMLYPFKRDTLVTVLDTLKWLQDDLNTSLQILTLAMVDRSQRQESPILTELAPNVTNTCQISSIDNQSDRGAFFIENKLHIIEHHLMQMQIDHTRASPRSTPGPHLLQFALEHEKALDEQLSHSDIILAPQRRRSKQCSCVSRSRTAHMGRAQIDNSPCELHGESKRVITLLNRRVFCNWTVRISLLASFWSTEGAGGFSISPWLEFRATVPRDSGVFLVLKNAGDILDSRDVSGIIQDVQKRLFDIISEGKGALSDEMEGGDTALHVVAEWQEKGSLWDTRSWLTWRSFINSILHAGSSPGRINQYGRTPVDIMIERSPYIEKLDLQQINIDTCSDMLELGGHVTCVNYNTVFDFGGPAFGGFGRPFTDGRKYLLSASGKTQVFEFASINAIWKLNEEKGFLVDPVGPRELQPLLYRSMELLASDLRMDKYVLQDIHHYVRWPPGLALLLQSEHARVDGLLGEACVANCKESVVLILDDPRCSIGKNDLLIASSHPDPTIGALILHALCDRRRRLQNLALEYLPKEINQRLNIRPETLLNVHAYEAHNLLCAASVNLKHLSEHETWSVFDWFGINLEFADRLYDAGFRDVDYIDRAGDNCLSTLQNYDHYYLFTCGLEECLQKLNWLINKGADFHHQSSHGHVLHGLGIMIGIMIGSKVGLKVGWMIEAMSQCKTSREGELTCFDLEIRSLSKSSIDLLKMIFYDDTRDDCECICSLNNCQPLAAFLNMFQHWVETPISQYSIQCLIELLAIVIDNDDDKSTVRHKKHLSATVLRFITFWSLGLTHTCAHGNRGIEPEEIEEIHDEEKVKIMDISNLLEKLFDELEVSKLDLLSFIRGPWQTQMDSFMSSSKPHSDEEFNRMLDIGVIIHKRYDI